jgi:mannose-6-phosphate isomerase
VKPLELAPNLLHRFYRGGARIAELRGIPHEDEYAPEDWVGSATEAFGTSGPGLSRLEDGTTLAEAFAADPEAYFGPEHAARHGGDPRLLVKLLDAGERLPVHFHPDRAFARAALGSPYGKSEAWWIADAEPGAAVGVGFRDPVEAETVAAWVEAQDAAAMLRALHTFTVEPGDTIFVPAGTPHAIGEGILLVELQEPSDLSVLLEWAGFALDGERDGHLGLGFERALEALDRSATSTERLGSLREGRGETRPGVETLFPAEADAFFHAERIRGPTTLGRAFSILIVVAGTGRLRAGAGGVLELRRGSTVLVPHAAGACELDGVLDVLRCLPPRPED